MESYLDLVRMAREQGSVRFYMAYLNGRLVESIIVVRDGNTAHYVAGALDVEGIKGHTTASPATLLHWNAMRDFCRLGVKYYSFGGTVFAFKKKFRPLRRDFPPPVTVIIRPLLYRIFTGIVPRLQPFGTALRNLAARVFAKHTRSAEAPNSPSPPAGRP
jgi:lipid II:glycine glycyltransferase (peptidoglycan interpeptide bridge formation enzyme)